MTLPMSVQTPLVHVDVLVCWQSATAEQSWAWVSSHASTHTGLPTPPSAPHVWQHEFGASHEDAPHMTLWAPRSASLELTPPSGPEPDTLASEPVVPELEPVPPELEPAPPELDPAPPELEPESGLEGVSPPLELDPHPAIPASADNAMAIAEGK